MWSVAALIGAIISVIGMLLIAWKWRLPFQSITPGVFALAIAVAVPFLWIYHTFQSFWTAVVGAGAQVGLSLVIALAIILYRFWRDPERRPPQEEGVVVSPADGQVIFIRSIPGEITPLVVKDGQSYSLRELAGIELADCSMSMIGIEMNILNVHVNRCPIAGQVKLVKSIKGGFISLRNVEAPFANARCTTLIKNDALTVAVVQIASRLVRRVDNYLRPDQAVILGERLGMIRFGSQVTVIFPDRKNVEIQVHIGQAVQAGTSILARYS